MIQQAKSLRIHIGIKVLLFALVVYAPLFLHLENIPIRLYDESRLAVNAYEMYENGDYLLTYFNGEPDMWNTKPPLLIWLQSFGFHIFGPGELAVRLPSALAALLTCLALLLLGIRYLKSYRWGLITVLILVTSQGYISLHGTRTGDYDALLTLFTTIYALAFFGFIEKSNTKLLHLFFAGLALAILTKSSQAMILLPALLLYAILRKQLIPLLKNKWLWINTALLIVIVGGYYVLREQYNPGYIRAVWENEFGGRYASTIEGHRHEFGYYYSNMIEERYSYWIWFVPIGMALGLFSRNQQIKQLTAYCSLLATSYFLIISTAGTKIFWYDLPLYPFLAIIVTAGIYWLYDFLWNNQQITSSLTYNVVPYLLLFGVFVLPYRAILANVYFPADDYWGRQLNQISHFIHGSIRSGESLDGTFVCQPGYNASNLFYIKLLNEKGQKVSYKDWNELNTGDRVIAADQPVKDSINAHYEVDTLRQFMDVNEYYLAGPKYAVRDTLY